MLPTHRILATLLGDRLICGIELKELSLVRRLSRASRVDAKLISSNPSLLDMKDEVLYCLQRSWLGAVVHWMAILSSPLLGVENNTYGYL